MERTKDIMVTFKSVTRGKNSKGGDRVQLSLTQEGTVALIEALTALASNERGVKLDVHVSRKQTKDGTREFDSAIAFVKAIEAFGANTGKKSFPTTPSKGYVDQSKLQEVKAKLANKQLA